MGTAFNQIVQRAWPSGDATLAATPMVAVDAIPGGAVDSTRTDLTVGSSYSVEVVAQNIPTPGLGSISFDLVYDQTVIGGVSVTAGPLVTGMTVSVANPDIDTALSLGRARFTCAFNPMPGSGPSGNGVLATFSFSVAAVGHSDVLLQNISLTNVNGTTFSMLTQNASLSSGAFFGLSVPGFGVNPSPAADGMAHTIGPITITHTGTPGTPITITQVIAGAGLLLSPAPAWVKYGGATPVPFKKPDIGAPVSEIVWKGPWTLSDNGSSLQLWFFAVSLEPGHAGEFLDLHVRITGATGGQSFSVKQAVDRPIQPCGDNTNKCLSGIVRDGIQTNDRHANPLKGAKVELRQGGATVAGPIATDQAGVYRFTNLAAGDYRVRVTLQDGETPAPNYIFDVRHYVSTASPPFTPAAWVEVKVMLTNADTFKTRDIAFSNAETIEDSDIAVADRPHLDDMANIFFRLRQYVDWLKSALNVTFNTTNRPAPVEVVAYSQLWSLATDPNNAFYIGPAPGMSHPPTVIHLGTNLSSYPLRDDRENDGGPESVEWHEFTHHIFATNISDADCPGNNHGGYNNSNTCDSLNEGLATFLPTLAWQHIEGGTDSNYDGMGANLESNGLKAWGKIDYIIDPGQPNVTSSVQREEFAVAALLWDLVDANADAEATQVVSGANHVMANFTDNISLPPQMLWAIIAAAQPTTVVALRNALMVSPFVPNEYKTISVDLDGIGGADVAPLDVPFLMHGFYPVNPNFTEDDPNHGHYRIGDPVGRSDHVDADGTGPGTALTARNNTQRVPKAKLRINVQDTNGIPLPGATAVLNVVYPELTDTLLRPLDGGTGNLVYLELPPYFRGRLAEGQPLPPCNPLANYVVNVTLSVTRNGLVSTQQFQFDNCQYTQAVAAATGDFALEFTFTLPPECAFAISPASKSYAANGGNGSVSVTVGPGCNWTAVSNAEWINITSGGSGTGNGTVTYSVAPNPSTTTRRTATLTIAGQTFTVVQGQQFLDVPTDYLFYNFIGKLAARGVTLGCGGGNYCPEANVTREQMAAFIIRALGQFNPPPPAMQRFNDVPPTNIFYAFIDQMVVRQITFGCQGNPPLYCPTNAVTREQMAAFIIRALHEPGYTAAPPTQQRFNDVPISGPQANPFAAFIEELALRQITLGCSSSPPLYCPTSPVTRGQMAAFLVRAFDL